MATQAENVNVDPAFEDEAYDSSSVSAGSYATSIATYIREGVELNGRRYASYGEHVSALPIDEAEQERNDLQHAKFYMVIGNTLHLAPVSGPMNILDLGTGSGIWAIDVAEKFEAAQVIGVDIAAVQPQWVPPNCQFEILDVESEWLMPLNSFDLIHGRELIAAIRDWDHLIKQSYDHLKPGAYLELGGTYPRLASDDGSLRDDSFNKEGERIFEKIGDKLGTSIYAPETWKKRMEKAGFLDVQEKVFKMPLGPWPKDKQLKKIGAFHHHALVTGLDAYLLRGYTQVLQGKPEELQIVMEGIKRESKDPKIHGYVYYYDVVGRKPEAAAAS